MDSNIDVDQLKIFLDLHLRGLLEDERKIDSDIFEKK
jgi:predicted RNase H-like HicB family nuclease